MSKLVLGQLRLEAVPDGIWLRNADIEVAPIHLGLDQARQLEKFLREQNLSERRVGFRVPVHTLAENDEPLQCTLQLDAGRWHPVTVIDFSLTGILVRTPDLDVGEDRTLQLTVALGDMQTSLTAKVVRSQSPLLALHFVESLQNGELNPPEPLVTIYRELEARWLRVRIPSAG